MKSESKEFVVLVDREDREVGLMEKMEAHRQGVLHRAFSVFLFNDKGELLLHQRAYTKYHSAGLWTNTCCSHPRAGEKLEDAVNRRLQEEMGIQCNTERRFSFIYQADLEHDLIEHELDHVFLGFYNAEPQPDSDEVNAWKYMSIEDIRKDMQENPESYTAWFRIVFEQAVVQFKTMDSLRKAS
jgi:isopentenyl-diphosphate delta-isomerase